MPAPRRNGGVRGVLFVHIPQWGPARAPDTSRRQPPRPRVMHALETRLPIAAEHL